MTFDPPARAMIVDDETSILEICQEALADSFAVDCFDNPVKALAHIKEAGPPDVVMTDIRMPEMSGIEFLSAIREAGFDVPVIIVTGYADREAAVKGLNLGAFALIDKPFALSTVTIAAHRAAAFQLMRKISNELLPQYMFLADSLHESIGSYKQKTDVVSKYIDGLEGETKTVGEKIFQDMEISGTLQGMVDKHESQVASFHEEEERLRNILKVLETNFSQ